MVVRLARSGWKVRCAMVVVSWSGTLVLRDGCEGTGETKEAFLLFLERKVSFFCRALIFSSTRSGSF